MEKSYAQIGKVTKSITFEPIGIFKRGKRHYVGHVKVFQYTKMQSYYTIELEMNDW